MNALRKLLEAERYHSFISRDSILQTVVEGYSGMTELDHDKGTMDYDLCESLSELESKIDSGAAAGRPMFAYTQPQNIHISVINRQGAKSIDGLSYPGFYAPYASRMRRMDSCFGKFVGFLKRKNIYDSSIVILTADHGDSLGEQGRWGHAYTIYPEILRIPLILHVPESVRRGLDVNTREVAFSTDITPTLYYLLGHKPKPLGEMFGKPLFTETPEERVVFESKHYMVASSYAAVYGLISRNGNDLFVADAVNQKEMFFDLTSDSSSESSVSRPDSALYENHLRDKILALNKFFRYTPPTR
jgi:arylsulfatase A-like enzyme